jgi:transposase
MLALGPARGRWQRGVAMIAGIDTHKDTLAVAVIDDAGRVLACREYANDGAGFTRLCVLIEKYAVRRVGIEGSANYGWPAAMRLTSLAGVEVVEVPPLLTSRERTARPGQGKTDPIDAVAIARITAREADLPPVKPMTGIPADLRVLLDYRDQLIAARTAMVNRVHVELTWLHPGYQHRIGQLTLPAHYAAALELLAADQGVRADTTRRRLAHIGELHQEIRDLKAQIRDLVAATGTSLPSIYGVGPVTAGRIIAEVVDIRRYRSRNAFAAANGTAPIPASSGRTVRHRLNRGGNRTLNRCLYTIAITQIRADTEARAYYLRKRDQGKTPAEARRCVKRHLSDIVYRTLHADLAHQAG